LEIIDNKENLQQILKSLPEQPGVYRFFDNKQNLLYIGKAKNIKKRVNSYFSHVDTSSGKIKLLVKKISDIQYIIVDNEYEALLLENTLIKEYQPRYNVMLKDDKTYPWICIKNEPFSRVFITRNYINDGSEYFGPYPSVKMIQTLFDLIRKLYHLRTCRFNLTPANIASGKFKVCLEYHIGNCSAPCVGKITQEEYNDSVMDIRNILKGNINLVTNHLKNLMNKYADELKFEKAQTIKDKLTLIEHYQGKSTVVNPAIHNVDVFNIITDENTAYVNFLKVVNGSVIQAYTLELLKKLDETPKELLQIAIVELRQRFNSSANEIIVPFPLNLTIPDITITVPQKGDKKHLLELSGNNVKHYILEKKKKQELVDPNIQIEYSKN